MSGEIFKTSLLKVGRQSKNTIFIILLQQLRQYVKDLVVCGSIMSTECFHKLIWTNFKIFFCSIFFLIPDYFNKKLFLFILNLIIFSAKKMI